MPQLSPPAFPGARWTYGAALLLSAVSLFSPSDAGVGGVFPGSDKVGHIALFALVAATGWLAGVPLRWLLPGVLAYAVGSEVVQGAFLPHRAGDPADVVADTVGVLLGLGSARRFRHLRHERHLKHERPLPEGNGLS